MDMQAASVVASRAPLHASNTSPLRLLVVDDDPVHRMVIGKVGEKAGYTVSTATTVDEAADRIAQQKYDCISLDLALGGQSGARVLRGIARANGDVLLIIMNGAASEVREESIETARDLRLKIVEVPKPVDLAGLRAKLVGHAGIARL